MRNKFGLLLLLPLDEDAAETDDVTDDDLETEAEE
jgi:hypothetical protein